MCTTHRLISNGHHPNPRGVAIPPFYAGQIGAQAAERARRGLEVIPMHFGQPSEGASPAALGAARAHLEGRPDGSAGYWESAALRERIAQHYREQHEVDVAPERILLTTGASAGLVATFTALFAAGDRVALARPGYPAYRNALRALGRVPVEIDCGPEHGFRLAPELLPSASEPLHGLLVASPANPTGTVLGGPELSALAAECRRRGTRLDFDPVLGNAFVRFSFAISEREVDRAIALLGPWLARRRRKMPADAR
jgi:aspartate/methionine/tyrosine aminotransferase